MKNSILKFLIALASAVMMMSAFSVIAFAQVPDSVNSADAAPPETTEETTEEPKEEEKKEEKKEETKPLTPDGNLTLVDDIKTTSDGDKQFLTVVSKNGNYFYIIVDRADNGENNVHFLNLVDERDLEDLIEGELSVNQEPEPVIIEQPTPEPVKEPEPEPEPKKGLGTGAIAGGILLLLALAGGGAYYLKFVKSGSNGDPDYLSEYDLEEEEDDDELEVEEWKEDDEEPEEPKPEPTNYFKERQKAYGEKVAVIDGEEMTREEIIDELFGGEDE